MIISASLISGFMLGCEWYTDDEDGLDYFILDLGIFRIVCMYGESSDN